jgi:hypothetical protein
MWSSSRITLGAIVVCVAGSAVLAHSRDESGALSFASLGLFGGPKRPSTDAPPRGTSTDTVPRASIDPVAKAVVERMSRRLKALTAFSVHAETTKDEVLESGPKVLMSETNDITVRRPDSFKAVMHGDMRDQQMFFNGQTLTVFNERLKYYAQVPAKGTLTELYDVAEKKYHVPIPLVDLVHRASAGTLLSDVTAGIVVGKSIVNGVECDHLAFHQKDVDWQIWVERGDRALPQKLLITTLDEDGDPQYIAHLTWNLSPTIAPNTFAFVPPAGAAKIPIVAAAR